MITKEALLEIGKKKNLSNKEYIEKDYFQEVMLSSLFRTTNNFIFKGGTALYKIHKLPRFSEDLDFSLLKPMDMDEINQIISKSIYNSYFKIKSVKETKDSVLIKLECKGIITSNNALRIDINTKNKVLSKFIVHNYTPDYIDINPFSLRVLSKEEMIAEKIHAILTKEKARHVFDLFYLLRTTKFNKELAEKKLKIFNIHYSKKAVVKKITAVSSIWEKELRPFVFDDIPSFQMAKSYIEENLPQ
ncbi:nucleotidyl transferase AbiEii/AbiGii toxin family protein [Candidatus Woesearchaeota archaeon]|nr:nucleotidyl transferase AbiEii/AbiGii toxin family protein [Candidatus Woesearchaeota archaeon]